MLKRNLCASFLAASMALTPVQQAQAGNAAEKIAIGVGIGILVNALNKNKHKGGGSKAPNPHRQQNRNAQSALNYFGFQAGSVDGVMGRNSRNAVAQYQSRMGFHADGRLDPHEHAFLTNSHQRALNHSHMPPYNQIMASQGPSGLLRAYRNEQLGVANVAPPPVQRPIPMPTPVPLPRQVAVPDGPAPVPSLPVLPLVEPTRSISAHCDQISALTAANGGLSTATRVNDVEFALNEQFCMARTHATADATALLGTMPGVNAEQISTQCTAFAQFLAPHVARVESDSADIVLRDTRQVLDGSGQPTEQLAMTARVCLGMGYRADKAEMALASAVMLSALGQHGYGELVSHQVREGFGTLRQPKNATAWMALTLKADTTDAPVLGQTADRLSVLALSTGAAPKTAALPLFQIPTND